MEINKGGGVVMSPDNISGIIAAMIALIGAILAFLALKKQIAVDAAAKNQFVWISEVRTLIYEFIKLCLPYMDVEYDDDLPFDDEICANVGKREEIYFHIQLYIHPCNNTHRALDAVLRECRKPYLSNDDIFKVVEAWRLVFSTFEEHLKSEAGVKFQRKRASKAAHPGEWVQVDDPPHQYGED
jgi:hypothetical protein